ncbi:MAG: dihydroorotate dehydrogenase electron transfer subunit [Candidatus Hydrothermarchaeaceae archaeon]
MEITKIKDTIREAEGIKTFRVELEADAVPGQFVMAWIPGVGEKPLSLSHVNGNLGITVLARGSFTQRLHDMKIGDPLGIRGPFGEGFRVEGDKLLIVGGGVGMAPLASLAEKAIRDGKDATVIVGAGTDSKLLFVDRLKAAGAKVLTTTDDGTCGGIEGCAPDALAELLKTEMFDQCFTCGPEMMMHKVMQQTRDLKIPTQLSIERYIKCGIGICSHCAIDDTGLRVCREGPVFTDEELENSEFGKYARDATGKRVYFKA